MITSGQFRSARAHGHTWMHISGHAKFSQMVRIAGEPRILYDAVDYSKWKMGAYRLEHANLETTGCMEMH